MITFQLIKFNIFFIGQFMSECNTYNTDKLMQYVDFLYSFNLVNVNCLFLNDYLTKNMHTKLKIVYYIKRSQSDAILFLTHSHPISKQKSSFKNFNSQPCPMSYNSNFPLISNPYYNSFQKGCFSPRQDLSSNTSYLLSQKKDNGSHQTVATVHYKSDQFQNASFNNTNGRYLNSSHQNIFYEQNPNLNRFQAKPHNNYQFYTNNRIGKLGTKSYDNYQPQINEDYFSQNEFRGSNYRNFSQILTTKLPMNQIPSPEYLYFKNQQNLQNLQMNNYHGQSYNSSLHRNDYLSQSINHQKWFNRTRQSFNDQHLHPYLRLPTQNHDKVNHFENVSKHYSGVKDFQYKQQIEHQVKNINNQNSNNKIYNGTVYEDSYSNRMIDRENDQFLLEKHKQLQDGLLRKGHNQNLNSFRPKQQNTNNPIDLKQLNLTIPVIRNIPQYYQKDQTYQKQLFTGQTRPALQQFIVELKNISSTMDRIVKNIQKLKQQQISSFNNHKQSLKNGKIEPNNGRNMKLQHNYYNQSSTYSTAYRNQKNKLLDDQLIVNQLQQQIKQVTCFTQIIGQSYKTYLKTNNNGIAQNRCLQNLIFNRSPNHISYNNSHSNNIAQKYYLIDYADQFSKLLSLKQSFNQLKTIKHQHHYKAQHNHFYQHNQQIQSYISSQLKFSYHFNFFLNLIINIKQFYNKKVIIQQTIKSIQNIQMSQDKLNILNYLSKKLYHNQQSQFVVPLFIQNIIWQIQMIRIFIKVYQYYKREELRFNYQSLIVLTLQKIKRQIIHAFQLLQELLIKFLQSIMFRQEEQLNQKEQFSNQNINFFYYQNLQFNKQWINLVLVSILQFQMNVNIQNYRSKNENAHFNNIKTQDYVFKQKRNHKQNRHNAIHNRQDDIKTLHMPNQLTNNLLSILSLLLYPSSNKKHNEPKSYQTKIIEILENPIKSIVSSSVKQYLNTLKHPNSSQSQNSAELKVQKHTIIDKLINLVSFFICKISESRPQKGRLESMKEKKFKKNKIHKNNCNAERFKSGFNGQNDMNQFHNQSNENSCIFQTQKNILKMTLFYRQMLDLILANDKSYKKQDNQDQRNLQETINQQNSSNNNQQLSRKSISELLKALLQVVLKRKQLI